MISDTNWEEKAYRWRNGIDVLNAGNEDLLDYIQTKTYQYRNEEARDKDLWDLYQEEFNGFTVATFKTLGSRPLQLLRNTLKARGVYVPQNTKHITLAEVLYHTLQEDERHQ